MPEAPAPSSKPRCWRDDALAVLKRLREAGHTAYFAGGCVRDELLGIEPKDYDVATDAQPDCMQRLFASTQAVGAAFGVVLVRHRRSLVEVATFRQDDEYLDGRRPSKVHFASAEQDARRRDFTINGLFLDPIDQTVIDYVGGQQDLRDRVLRAIGDAQARFAEDQLRLLRAVRFAARFGLTIESQTAAAIHAHAVRLKAISPERIAEELRLIFTPATRNAAWLLLAEFKLLDVIFRYARPATATQDDPLFRVFVNLGAEPVQFGLALAAALVSRQKEPLALFQPAEARLALRAMSQGLRISNNEAGELYNTLVGIGPMLAEPAPTLAAKKRFLARPTATLSLRLMTALKTAGFMSDRIELLQRELRKLSRTTFAPPPLISGADLIAQGLSPGPAFKRVLHQVYDAQLEQRLTTKQQAIELAMKLAAG